MAYVDMVVPIPRCGPDGEAPTLGSGLGQPVNPYLHALSSSLSMGFFVLSFNRAFIPTLLFGRYNDPVGSLVPPVREEGLEAKKMQVKQVVPRPVLMERMSRAWLGAQPVGLMVSAVNIVPLKNVLLLILKSSSREYY